MYHTVVKVVGGKHEDARGQFGYILERSMSRHFAMPAPVPFDRETKQLRSMLKPPALSNNMHGLPHCDRERPLEEAVSKVRPRVT